MQVRYLRIINRYNERYSMNNSKDPTTENVLVEQRRVIRHDEISIPEVLKTGIIVFENGCRLTVKVINMSSCGFLFRIDNGNHDVTGTTVNKGEQLTIEFPLIKAVISGICIHRTTIESSDTCIGFYISNPHDQNYISEIIHYE